MYPINSHTSRLQIRKLEISDIELWEPFFENNPSLPYLGLNLVLDKKTQAKDWIDRQLWRYTNNKFGHHALIEKTSGKFVGQCGLLLQEVDGQEEIEVGYSLLPEFWGKGYATEAACFFRDFAFEEKLCNSLISIIDIRNVASQNVAMKLGMKKTRQIKYQELEVFIYRVEEKARRKNNHPEIKN